MSTELESSRMKPLPDTAAVTVDDVSKIFRMYHERAGNLKELFTKGRLSRYDEFPALCNVSFEIEEGSVFALVGHNGCGKSSLLRIMAGIHRPTSGRITTRGRISALLELGAGFHPELTGRENVYLNAAILGLRRTEVDDIFDQIVEFSGLEAFIDSPVKHYSSGMYVRLGFSVAVNVDPQILIIDEVIAVGDEEFQRRCFEHLATLRDRGITIVMVTHSLNLVQTICDRAAWLDHGKLMAVGPAAEVVHQYLTQVNETESERLEDDRRADTTGGGRPHALRSRLSFERFEFLDASGHAASTALPLEPLTVRLHFRCEQPIDAPLFSFAVETEHGVYLANPGMRAGDRSTSYVGTNHVDYRIPSLPFAPGTYNFSFAAHDAHGLSVLDKQERAAVLRVQPGPTIVAGQIDLLGDWEEGAAGRDP